MKPLRDEPHLTIPSGDLASWIAAQSDTWWYVDGDPMLNSQLSFPCPSESLSKALELADRDLLLFDCRDNKSESVPLEQLDKLANRENRRSERTWLCSWDGDGTQWLLSEDLEASTEQD